MIKWKPQKCRGSRSWSPHWPLSSVDGSSLIVGSNRAIFEKVEYQPMGRPEEEANQ